MKTIEKFFVVMNLVEKILAIVFFVVMFLLFVYQIFVRYFFTPITWIQEAILAMFLWVLIFATCFAEQTEENIRFTSFYDRCGKKGRLVCDLIASILVVATLTIMFPSTLDYIKYSLKVQAPTLRLPIGYIFMPFLYLMFSFWLKFLKRTILNIHAAIRIFGKEGA